MLKQSFTGIVIFFSLFFSLDAQEKRYGTKKLSTKTSTYLCVMNKSTGFFFNKDNREWEVKNFSTENQKFLIEIYRDKGVFFQLGSSRDDFFSKCKKNIKFNLLTCNGSLGIVNFNMRTNLITHSNMGNYAFHYESIFNYKNSEPSVSVGKCSMIESK